jgi:hypothetical protein
LTFSVSCSLEWVCLGIVDAQLDILILVRSLSSKLHRYLALWSLLASLVDRWKQGLRLLEALRTISQLLLRLLLLLIRHLALLLPLSFYSLRASNTKLQIEQLLDAL